MAASRVVRVAAVQLDCIPNGGERNRANAAAWIAQAAGQGAQLVLLPEMMPGGYLLSEDIWDSAEPAGSGPSLAWLRDTARRHGIHLGMSLLEVEGEDFYNAFYLATPDGGIAGRVRKQPPASVEAYLTRAGDDPHVIDTELGRIGVGICYENLLHCRMAELHAASVDLVLQPTSAAAPTPAFPIRRKDSLSFGDFLAAGPGRYARALGVPVVMANKCGRLVTELPAPFPAQDTVFPGRTQIVDGDGCVQAAMGAEEGVIVADVTLDPARKVAAAPTSHGRWSMPVPWYGFLWPLTQWTGERAYAANERRKKKARTMAGLESAVSRTP
jgi:N-carbamoylputrescine amidase